ncbi:MAG: HK97 family phage prohead protease [Maritimibacter sp.]|nr:HK97 family phage prohead protease [Maritimibacter sp.]
MLWGGHGGGLELRREGGGNVTLSGSFPYNKPAVLTDGGRNGRPRKERIASRAFRYRVERPTEEIHFLVGHDYGRPLASRLAGSLRITETDDSLSFDILIEPDLQQATYVRDFLAAHDAGLVRGVSPGFRIPPARVAPNAETVEEEDPAEGMAIIRTVHEALLYELSAVTRPAYPEAQIEARSWEPTGASGECLVHRPAAYRWR